jgi:acetyl-CoA carboxylase carboxyltransferase component
MTWEPELEELRSRQALAREMGGPTRSRASTPRAVSRCASASTRCSMPARSPRGRRDHGQWRVRRLRRAAGMTPTNFVFGRGRIDGRRVAVAGDDFTVRGGAADASIIEKQVAAEQMAHELRLPLVRLVEGSGGGGSVKSLEAMGYTYVPFLPGWEHMVANLATVPVVSLGLGPVAGFGAAKVVASHYSLLVRGQSQMFVAGPPVVAAAGQTLTKEELGSSRIHAGNGAVDDEVESEQEAFARARASCPTCPPPCMNCRRAASGLDDPARRDESWSGRAARPAPGVSHAADRRDVVDRELFRDRPAARAFA